jgi:hypothetical protein
MGAFFLGCFRVDFGTSDGAEALEELAVVVGFWRRELKLEMNSMDCGDSPRRLLKWSAASCFERVAA